MREVDVHSCRAEVKTSYWTVLRSLGRVGSLSHTMARKLSKNRNRSANSIETERINESRSTEKGNRVEGCGNVLENPDAQHPLFTNAQNVFKLQSHHIRRFLSQSWISAVLRDPLQDSLQRWVFVGPQLSISISLLKIIIERIIRDICHILNSRSALMLAKRKTKPVSRIKDA